MKVRVDQQKWIETEQLKDLEYQLPNLLGCHLFQSRKGTFVVKATNVMTGSKPSYRLATNKEVQGYLDSIESYYFDSDEI